MLLFAETSFKEKQIFLFSTGNASRVIYTHQTLKLNNLFNEWICFYSSQCCLSLRALTVTLEPEWEREDQPPALLCSERRQLQYIVTLHSRFSARSPVPVYTMVDLSLIVLSVQSSIGIFQFGLLFSCVCPFFKNIFCLKCQSSVGKRHSLIFHDFFL